MGNLHDHLEQVGAWPTRNPIEQSIAVSAAMPCFSDVVMQL